eukprot:5197501-Lingulodinium_polyedra.AAC.1
MPPPLAGMASAVAAAQASMASNSSGWLVRTRLAPHLSTISTTCSAVMPLRRLATAWFGGAGGGSSL